jgi:hypothetical protein
MKGCIEERHDCEEARRWGPLFGIRKGDMVTKKKEREREKKKRRKTVDEGMWERRGKKRWKKRKRKQGG